MNRKLSRGSAAPGPFDPTVTPYLDEPYRAAVDAQHRRVVLVMATQSSKTEFLLNVIGHTLDDNPRPILFVAASQRQAESISTSRVAPMIDGCESLAAKLDRRESKDRVTEKYISGVSLTFGWAGSAVSLSSHPCGLVVLDELDHMPTSTGGEGDPMLLSQARTATYGDGKVIAASTPTLENASGIWGLWESGTACKWTFPCPECGVYFVPCYDTLKWPPKASPSQAKKSAWLQCPDPKCEAHITERHKPQMNAHGRYEITADADSDCASYWVSGLASPWRTWGQCAAAWIEAARSHEPTQQQSIMNTYFGELWRETGEAPAAEKVKALRAAFHFDEVPIGARVITAGVDLGAYGMHYVIRAWGRSSTSWLLRHGELYGSTQIGEPIWDDLRELLEAEYGTLGRVRLCLVDSGYLPDAAYSFSRRTPGVLPSKGAETQSKPVYISRLDVNVRGAPARRGQKLVHVDAGYFKQLIHGRIGVPPDQPGAWHLPLDATEDFCEQLVAESRVTKANGTVKWIKTKKANHYFDCEVLAAAAAHLLQVHLLRDKPAADAVDSGEPSTPSAAPQQPQQPRQPPARRQVDKRWARGPNTGWSGSSSRNWMKSWRY